MAVVLHTLKAVESTFSLLMLKEMYWDAPTEVWNHAVRRLEGSRKKASDFCFWRKVSFEPMPYRQRLPPDTHISLVFLLPLSFLVPTFVLKQSICAIFTVSQEPVV